MLRTGRSNIIYSGSVTWTAGDTITSAKTLSISMPASAGLTTLLHEVIFTTNCTASISADLRPVMTIGGSTYYGDLNLAVSIPGLSTVKSLAVGAVNFETRGLFNNASAIVALLLSSAATTSITVNCVIQELEGT